MSIYYVLMYPQIFCILHLPNNMIIFFLDSIFFHSYVNVNISLIYFYKQIFIDYM